CRLQAASPDGVDLALCILAHDLKSAAGHADIDAHSLAFAAQGLQPAALSPLAAGFRDAVGPADFTGRFDWTAKAVTSQGVLETAGLSFKSPLGGVDALKGRLVFTSLAPLVTAPGQALSIGRLDGAPPLPDAGAPSPLTATAFVISTASAKAAGGEVRLEPMSVAFDPKATTRGALVLDHVSLGELLAGSSLADSVKLDAVVD